MSETRGHDAMMADLSMMTCSDDDPASVLQAVCHYLCRFMAGCHWAGYYLVDPDRKGELFLGPYYGSPTEHGRIAFGEGICGQAASGLKTFLVSDVSMEDNYLSCSPDVRSEIVVPVFFRGELVGEIDLDSHDLAGFSESDGTFLEWLAERTGHLADSVRKGADRS
ncbi:MAG: GAF domain-containing protein [Candidatus Fermentibacteraceae bacterium]|nr:GAF domain-containing protein [Candidatus Fermentibacteraceae bacterium]